jgi:23S rRNA A1618 N6-methylase RlmF
MLTRALLAEDFNIKVWDIPEGCLIPPIPQRLNYLCWVKELKPEEDLTFLDM